MPNTSNSSAPLPAPLSATHRQEEAHGGEQHAVHRLLVDALAGAQGPDVQEGAAEDHEATEEAHRQDAVPAHVVGGAAVDGAGGQVLAVRVAGPPADEVVGDLWAGQGVPAGA